VLARAPSQGSSVNAAQGHALPDNPRENPFPNIERQHIMTDPTPAPAAQPAPAAPLSEADDKLWASLAHLGGILYLLPSLIIYLVLKDRGPKVRVEAKEALNWQITFLGGFIILEILTAIIGGIIVAASVSSLSDAGLGVAGILWILPFAWWVLNVIFSILGFVKVNGGGSYRYPFAIRLVK
jgi:uncharacterized protein